MTTLVTILWFLLAGIFTSLGLYFRAEARRRIPTFPAPDRFAAHPGAGIDILGVPIDAPLQEFVARVNAFIDQQNLSASRLSVTNSVGYFAAAATALLSALLENRAWIASLLAGT